MGLLIILLAALKICFAVATLSSSVVSTFGILQSWTTTSSDSKESDNPTSNNDFESNSIGDSEKEKETFLSSVEQEKVDELSFVNIYSKLFKEKNEDDQSQSEKDENENETDEEKFDRVCKGDKMCKLAFCSAIVGGGVFSVPIAAGAIFGLNGLGPIAGGMFANAQAGAAVNGGLIAGTFLAKLQSFVMTGSTVFGATKFALAVCSPGPVYLWATDSDSGGDVAAAGDNGDKDGSKP